MDSASGRKPESNWLSNARRASVATRFVEKPPRDCCFLFPSSSVSDVIRYNVQTLRKREGVTQEELARQLTVRTDELWTQFRISDIEGGRKGRQRTISPDELLALARELAVSVIELMTPPERMENRSVRVRVGTDEVTPDMFFRFAFLLPSQYRDRFGRRMFDLAVRDVEGWFGEATHVVFPEVTTTDEFERLLDDRGEEAVLAIFVEMARRHGLEAVWEIGSERSREYVMRARELGFLGPTEQGKAGGVGDNPETEGS